MQVPSPYRQVVSAVQQVEARLMLHAGNVDWPQKRDGMRAFWRKGMSLKNESVQISVARQPKGQPWCQIRPENWLAGM